MLREKAKPAIFPGNTRVPDCQGLPWIGELSRQRLRGLFFLTCASSAQNIPFARQAAHPACKLELHQDAQQRRRGQAALDAQLLHALRLCAETGEHQPLIFTVDGVTGKNTPNVTQYGLVHLDGTQATTYARIRKLSGDDFKRASRQRIVLQAMLEKAKKANPATLVKICNSVVDDISTTLSLDQMVSLAKDVTKYKISSTTGFPTDLTTKNMPRCGDTVIPADLVTNVKKLHEYMFDDAAYTPSQTVQAISDTIVNTTGITADSAKINTSDYNETVGATGTDEIQKGSETTGGTNVQ